MNNTNTNKLSTKASPVLKWAGGKTQILPQIRERYPAKLKRKSDPAAVSAAKERARTQLARFPCQREMFVENKINIYIEPFLGGGAVFFDIVSNFQIEQAYLFDTNPELIILYKVIQKDVDNLIEELSILSEKYLVLNNEERKLFYYSRRARYNCLDKKIDTSFYLKEWSERAALTVFLNRTCFNGLYRVNKKRSF